MDTTTLDRNIHSSEILIDGQSKTYLSEIRKWSKFLAIMGFVGAAILVLLGIFMTFFMGSLMSDLTTGSSVYPGYPNNLAGGFLGFMYIAFGVFYFFPSLYLFKFAKQMKLALLSDDQIELTESFKNLKSCFKFIGIVTLISVVLYAIMILFMIVGGGAALLMGG